MFLFPLWRRVETPVSLSIACVRLRFWKKYCFWWGGNICKGEIKGLAIYVKIKTLLKLHKEATCFFPLLATTGAASVPQLRRVLFELFFSKCTAFDGAKTCNGKIKGLAIHVKINTLSNLQKETTCFFPHYWRRREPPVSLSCGEFRSSVWINILF